MVEDQFALSWKVGDSHVARVSSSSGGEGSYSTTESKSSINILTENGFGLNSEKTVELVNFVMVIVIVP